MGCGKSTIGRLLANKLQLEFIDLDSYIETETQKSIPDIFASEGENKFRELEHENLKKLLSKDNIIIALGGGTPCFFNNMELINKTCVSIYLEVDTITLYNRLSENNYNRPLVNNLTSEKLMEYIEKNIKKRKKYYSLATHTINVNKLEKNTIQNKIIEKIKN